MKKIVLLFIILICSNANSIEIVKEVKFTSKNYFDSCGVPFGKFIFYSDGKSEETYTCPETKKINKFNGDWTDDSSLFDLPKLSLLTITYPDGKKLFIEFKTDLIKTQFYDKGITKQKNEFVYADEEYNEQKKSKTVKKKSNEDLKDLSGNAIECFGKYDKGLFKNEVTIQFLSKNKAKYAVVGYAKVGGEISQFDLLITGEEVKYKVLEKKIILKIDKIKNFYDPHKIWQRYQEFGFYTNTDKIIGEIWISRETLKLRNLGMTKDTSCSLVDANKSHLFNKYYEYNNILNKILQKNKKESESKNIL